MKILPIAKENIFNWIQDGVFVLDMDNNLIEYNSAAKLIFSEFTSSSIERNIEDSLNNCAEFLDKLYKCQNHSFEIKFQGVKDRYYDVRVSQIFDGDFQVGKAVLLSEVTKRVEMMQQLHVLASTDELTGAWNRRYLINNLKEEIKEAKLKNSKLCFVIFDIDFFKKINDTYGHLAGDAVLVEAVTRCKNSIGEKGQVGRFGGEEFSILLPQITSRDAFLICDVIRESFEKESVNFEGEEIKFTASFGITEYNETVQGSGDEIREFIKIADSALYRAKRNGRNRIEIG